MRGTLDDQDGMFSYVSLEARIPADHPLRAMWEMTDTALRALSRRFDAVYAKTGRPSIPPEQLLRAQVLQVLFSIRSERLLMEQLEYNLLFRWFVGLRMDDRVWDAPASTTANGFALVATYTYDAFGRRVKKVTPAQSFLYLYDAAGHLVEEVEKKPGTDHARDYAYLEDELVGQSWIATSSACRLGQHQGRRTRSRQAGARITLLIETLVGSCNAAWRSSSQAGPSRRCRTPQEPPDA
jgi:YD repeat-containing protein